MKLRLDESVEPMSPSASDPGRAASSPLRFIKSNEYDTVKSEIAKFVDGTIQGRSILLAGHRGSGKTLLVKLIVHELVAEVMKRAEQEKDRAWGYFPLYVPLHGPSMFAGDLGRKTLSTQDRIADELTQAIRHIVRAVYHAVADNIEDALHLEQDKMGRWRGRHELMQLISHLRLQMDDGLSVDEFRRIWARMDGLRKGLLHHQAGPLDGRPMASGRGAREILALAYATSAYRIVSARGIRDVFNQGMQYGTSQTTRRGSRFDIAMPGVDKRQPESGDAARPIAAGFVGGATGLVAGAAALLARPQEPWIAAAMATVIGLVAVLGATGASFAHGYARHRTIESRRKSARSIEFENDRSPATLRDMLPILLRRLRSIGLAPILVIDELDKVDVGFTDGPFKRFMDLAKSINQESATFLFLADREFFHRLQRELHTNPATTASSWFNQLVYLTYSPRELRQFAQSIV
ncbi:MAG: hypothetical protein AB7K86_04270 [Rhodospirillales bacterium]